MTEFRKLGGIAGLTENSYILQKLKLHPNASFSLSNHWPSNKRMSFKGVYEKTDFTVHSFSMFTRPVGTESR